MNTDKYLSLEYANRGRGKFVDCWGLAMRIYRDELGIKLPTLDGYADSENDSQIAAVISTESTANWEKVNVPEQYDIVVFRLAALCSHVGIMLSQDGRFIHALRGRNVSTGNTSSMLWRNRVDSFYRLRELA